MGLDWKTEAIVKIGVFNVMSRYGFSLFNTRWKKKNNIKYTFKNN